MSQDDYDDARSYAIDDANQSARDQAIQDALQSEVSNVVDLQEAGLVPFDPTMIDGSEISQDSIRAATDMFIFNDTSEPDFKIAFNRAQLAVKQYFIDHHNDYILDECFPQLRQLSNSVQVSEKITISKLAEINDRWIEIAVKYTLTEDDILNNWAADN